MSTPEIRAMSALPLLVTGIGADHLDTTVPTDHVALLAHLLDAWSNFHLPLRLDRGSAWRHPSGTPERLLPGGSEPVARTLAWWLDLLVAVGDAAATEVVRRELHL